MDSLGIIALLVKYFNIFWKVPAPAVAYVGTQSLKLFCCVCVHACVRACVVCVCVFVHVRLCVCVIVYPKCENIRNLNNAYANKLVAILEFDKTMCEPYYCEP